MPTGTPWVDWLPAPVEATFVGVSNALRDGLTPTRVRVTALEGPSVYHAIWRVCPDIEFVIDTTPSPDPRRPLRCPPMPLWRWEGVTPRPALPTPSSRTAAAVGSLAATPFNAARWLAAWKAAAVAAETHDVLSVAIHPPPSPASHDPLGWLWFVQHAVAFSLAGRAEPSLSGPDWDALWSMALVPNDWLAIAAISAVAARADRDPTVRPVGVDMVLAVLESRPDVGEWVTAVPSFNALLRLDREDTLKLRETAKVWVSRALGEG